MSYNSGTWDAVADAISPRAIAAALLERELVTVGKLTELVGDDPDSVSMTRMETVLTDAGIVSDQNLLSLKGMLSGLPTLESERSLADDIPAEVARAASAIKLAGDRNIVVFVEPNTDNIGLVAATLGAPFDTWLITTAQFRKMYEEVYSVDEVPKHPLGDVRWVLDETVRRRASDCHLKVEDPPKLRIDGAIVPLNTEAVSSEWSRDAITELLTPAEIATFEEFHDIDLAVEQGGRRFRLNIGRDREGPTFALRLLAQKVPSMDDLGLSDALRNFTSLERGLVLITGPTGSGKSTLLASILDHICRTQGRHVITLEDPIEYLLTEGPTAVVNQREQGQHFHGFANGIRQALRQDPDVILVGEMRDRETALAAVTAAETGHLVFSTLHTFDAQQTVARLISMYPTEEQDHAREKIAYILRGVVSQTLVPRANNPGRVAAQEIMLGTPAIANSLRSPGGLTRLRDTIQTNRQSGMQTMEMALAILVQNGVVAENEALFRARNPAEFQRYLHGSVSPSE